MYISVAQHLGAPALPVVEVGDKVKVGQVIAGPGGFVSAYVHSPVSGTVKSIGPRADLAGRPVTHIEIAVEGDEWMEGIDLSDNLVTEIPTDNQAIIEKIHNAGVVGLGGATFPTHIKLSLPPGSKCERVIINGCECEAVCPTGAIHGVNFPKPLDKDAVKARIAERKKKAAEAKAAEAALIAEAAKEAAHE